MRILRVHIKNFGKFQDRKIEFAPGMNIIYGENESGKSTLHTFIRGMFFGLRRMRGRASRNDMYSRYEPWEHASWYEGQLWFQCGQKNFRLLRNFQKENVREQLVCETDGELLSVEAGDLSMLLGEMNETVYNNTVSVGQLKSRTEEGMIEELRNYVSNYQGAMDEELDIMTAKRSLLEKRKEFERQRKERKEKSDAKLKEMELQMSYIQRDMKELEQKAADTKMELADTKVQITGAASIRWKVLISVIAMLAAIGIWIWSDGWLRILGCFLGISCSAFWAGSILLKKRYMRTVKQSQDVQKQEKYNWMQEQFAQNIKEKSVLLYNLQEEYRQMLQAQTVKGKLDDEIAAVNMAMQVIDEIARKLQAGVGARIRERTGEILCQLTEGKYKKVSIAEDFSISVDTGTRQVPAEHLSRGTLEQIYFAFRMAMGEVLCTEEKMPLILDDVFVMYDEKRLENTLRWLAEEKEQVLLFTCQKREMEILKKAGVPYHCVRL